MIQLVYKNTIVIQGKGKEVTNQLQKIALKHKTLKEYIDTITSKMK